MKTYQKIITYGVLYGVVVVGSLKLLEKCSDDRKSVASVSTGLGQQYPYIAVGDVTGDGKKDIVYGNEDGVFYLENLGNGKFRQPVKAGENGPIGYGEVPVAVGDVTGDGLEDIVLTNQSGIFVLRNLGEGRFAPLE